MEIFPVETLELDINNNLESLNKWFQINKLSLNATKTKFMIFRKRKQIQTTEIFMNNIKTVYFFRDNL